MSQVIQERLLPMQPNMVGATLRDEKTNTRRVIVPQPNGGYDPSLNEDGLWEWCADIDPEDAIGCGPRLCPYGKPGDRLLVQEAHVIHAEYKEESGQNQVTGTYLYDDKSFTVTLTDAEFDLFSKRKHPYAPLGARFMYRSLCRITLDITAIRVERIQDILGEDAKAEGVIVPKALKFLGEFYPGSTHRVAFQSLWDSINAARCYGWKENPWVWVVAFKRVQA